MNFMAMSDAYGVNMNGQSCTGHNETPSYYSIETRHTHKCKQAPARGRPEAPEHMLPRHSQSPLRALRASSLGSPVSAPQAN